MSRIVFGVQRRGVRVGSWFEWYDAGGDGDDCGPVVAAFATRGAAEARAAELEAEFRRQYDPLVSNKIGSDELNRIAPELAAEFGLPMTDGERGSDWWARCSAAFSDEQRLHLWERFAPNYRHYRVVELPVLG